MPWLPILVFLPAGAALGLAALPRVKACTIRAAAAAIAGITTLLSGHLFFHVKPQGLSYVWAVPWIPVQGFHIQLKFALDGTSAAMLVLSSLLSLLSMACSWKSITTHVKEFYLLLLVLETGMLGVFCSFDLFLFYIFWEITLIPMYFLIGVWGGPRRGYAAIKFILFTAAGSLFMLAAIIMVAWTAGTFDLAALKPESLKELDSTVRTCLFLAFFVAFAIKVPLFPLHTWLPDAHVEAPTAGSVLLAGVLLKMGAYGLVRLAVPLFPEASAKFAAPIMLLAVAGVVYGALMALVQGDIKRLIAYSSVSHLGLVVLGIFAFQPDASRGAVLEMVNHGLSTGALFMLVGMIYDRTHRRGIDDFGGLAAVMPRYAAVFLVVTLSSIGVPGLNGFVGEVLILMGTFQEHPWFAAGAALGVIFGAVYMLRLYRFVFFGELRSKANALIPDMTRTDLVTVAPILALIFLIGLVPNVILRVLGM